MDRLHSRECARASYNNRARWPWCTYDVVEEVRDSGSSLRLELGLSTLMMNLNKSLARTWQARSERATPESVLPATMLDANAALES